MTLSAVIPVYNRLDHLPGALASVLSQELPPGVHLELIVVDDGSDDGTSEYLARFAAPALIRYQPLHIPHCGMPGAVRNRGVALATGEVVAFLDSDDRWLPGKVTRQLPVHLSAAAALSHTRERWLRNGREISQAGQRHQREGDIFTDALQKCIIGPSTAMIDRKLFITLGGFREDLEVAEDYEFWVRALCHTPVVWVDEALTEKRAGDWPQLSERYGQIEGFRITALQQLVDEGYFARHPGRDLPGDVPGDAGHPTSNHPATDRQAVAAAVLARKLQIYAAGARKRGRLAEASALEEQAFLYQP